MRAHVCVLLNADTCVISILSCFTLTAILLVKYIDPSVQRKRYVINSEGWKAKLTSARCRDGRNVAKPFVGHFNDFVSSRSTLWT